MLWYTLAHLLRERQEPQVETAGEGSEYSTCGINLSERQNDAISRQEHILQCLVHELALVDSKIAALNRVDPDDVSTDVKVLFGSSWHAAKLQHEVIQSMFLCVCALVAVISARYVVLHCIFFLHVLA